MKNYISPSTLSFTLWVAAHALSKKKSQIEEIFDSPDIACHNPKIRFKEPLLEIRLKDSTLCYYCEYPDDICTCCYLFLNSEKITGQYLRHLDQHFPYHARPYDSFWVDTGNLAYICCVKYGATASILVFKKLPS